MATVMTMQKYVDYILDMLGGDFVEIEIKESIPKIVNHSLEELKEYLTLNKFVTVPYMKKIDLSKYNVKSVIQVYRTQPSDSISGTAGSTDAFLLAVGMVNGIPYDLTTLEQLLQIRKMKNTIATDLDWRWSDPFLFINQNPYQSTSVTIEYTPEVKSIEEITDDYWIGKLKKLALANSKIVLGRVRGKHTLSNALYVNDAQIMLAEGTRERDELLKFIQENSDMILPIGS